MKYWKCYYCGKMNANATVKTRSGILRGSCLPCYRARRGEDKGEPGLTLSCVWKCDGK